MNRNGEVSYCNVNNANIYKFHFRHNFIKVLTAGKIFCKQVQRKEILKKFGICYCGIGNSKISPVYDNYN